MVIQLPCLCEVQCNRSLFIHLFVQAALFEKLNIFMLSVPWTFLFFSPSFITTFSSRSQIWQPCRGACWSLCGLLPFSASQMTPNAYSVRLKGHCLMAVLSPPPHLQLALRTWKDAFPIRCNDRQVGGRQANNSGL